MTIKIRAKYICWFIVAVMLVLSGVPYVSYLFVRNKILAHHKWTHIQPDDVIYVSWMGLLGKVNGGITLAVYLDNPGGTVYIPNGSYVAPTALKSQINLIGAGRGQAEANACPTTITFNASTGTALNIVNMNHIRISDMCIVYTGSGTTATAISLGWGQFITLERLYIQGAWGIGLKEVCVEGQGTTGYNSFRDSHETGLAAGATGVLLDSTGCSNQTINNNYWFNWNFTGGTGGIALRIQGSGNTIENENVFIGGQWTTPSGTGISIQNSAVRDITFIGCDVEGNSQGTTIGTGNSGVFMNCNMSANGNNSAAANLVDNSAGGIKWINNNTAGTQSNFKVNASGDTTVNSLSFGAAASNGANTWNFGTGAQLWASGTNTVIFNNTDTTLNKPLINSSSAFANLGTPANGTQQYCLDCTIANPCAGGGTGAFAKRINGAWICN